MRDAYDSDKDKELYESPPPSTHLSGSRYDQIPQFTFEEPKYPDQEPKDILQPVESDLKGLPPDTLFPGDIATVDKKEGDHLNLHHGDRKQTNTTFENEKIGWDKCAEDAIDNYLAVKEAGLKDNLRAMALSLGLMGAPNVAKANVFMQQSHPLHQMMIKYKDYAPKVTWKTKNVQEFLNYLQKGQLPVKDIQVPIYNKRF
jgi:hypothetical protein